MKRYILLPIALAFVILASCSVVVTATPDQMEYTDEEGDLLMLGDPTGYEDDIDIVSVTVDQSLFPIVVVKITVKGNIVAKYDEEDQHNWYGFGLDLDGDEDVAEVGVQFTGPDEGKDSFVTVNNQTKIDPLTEGQYTISGSTFTVTVPIEYCAAYSEVKDFTARASQGFPGTSVSDAVNDLFGEDDKPYGYEEPADDDDTTDDDTTDDDTSDDDDDDSPGFTILLAISAFAVSVVIITRKRKNP